MDGRMPKREYAYQKIRNAITYGELKPGERLVEKRLCEMFKVGRTPLREALSQLQIEGYLDFTQNKGTTITRMSIQSVKEIYDTIALLEGYATELATKNLNTSDKKQLHLILNNLRKICNSNDHKKWLDENSVFHEYLVKASGNSLLHTLVASLRNRIYRYRLISLTIHDSLLHYCQAHEEILEAISKKDGKRAGKKMQRHVLGIAKQSVELLEKLPAL
ncbi:MAG: GntR family transcriptional regulator [Deltaproteobacteria bacterium]